MNQQFGDEESPSDDSSQQTQTSDSHSQQMGTADKSWRIPVRIGEREEYLKPES